jgi:hypothetical protein
MAMFKGAPPGPGAADARAASSYARSGLSTSTIQKPARNSLVSGKTPSVTGVPLSPARTSLAWSGPASPSAPTSSPDWVSSALKSFMNWM